MPDNSVLCIDHCRLSELRSVKVRDADTTAQLDHLCSCYVFPKHSLKKGKGKGYKGAGRCPVGEVLAAQRWGAEYDLQIPYVEQPVIIKHLLPQY